jgi:hypothetical protein
MADETGIEPDRVPTQRGKVVNHITFHSAEVAVSRKVFGNILPLIARLRAPPVCRA